MSYQPIQVDCRGCEEPFFVHAESNAAAPDADLCRSCRCFKAAMEHMMGNRPEPLPEKKMQPLHKGLVWGLVFVSPFWIAFVILYLRAR